MNTKIYNTIAEFFRSMDLEIEQSLDFTIHSLDRLHGEPPTSSPPFRTNYYTFLLIEDGLGHYTIDEHWFPLKPYSFYFTIPGHLKSFTIEKNVTGFMITFSESFLKANYPGSVESDFPFLFEETVPVMYLPEEVFHRLKKLCAILISDYQGASPFKERILANHLGTLLFHTKELLLTYQAKIELANRPAEIARAFKAAVNRNFLNLVKKKEDHIWTIQEHADDLHIHPNHLSSTVKAETGKPPKQWIDEKIISEAKSLLKNTSMTVAEIAYALAFDDASNFSRFFKKIARQTPNQYRNASKVNMVS
ncbi:AraC family transcriptional regulator [candidate division KSB1 bacterium]|nr:AraC family transcriptional regulator [candidate division KSB1 bacterium]